MEEIRDQKMNPEEYRQKKQQEREEVFDLLSQSTQTLLKPEELQQYLDLQGRFLQFSASNVLLIKAQNPEASWLRTFDEWKQDNVSVNRGEVGLKAMESSFYQREDGSMGRSMKVVRLFDLAQTNAAGRKITMPPYRNIEEYLAEAVRIPVERTDELPEGEQARWDPGDNCIYVDPALTPQQAFPYIAREAACMELAGDHKGREDVLPYAECAAYMLARHYGLEAEPPDLQRITDSFPGMEEKEVRNQLQNTKHAAEIVDARVMEARQRSRDDREAER
ncbi:MAG: hypothetical protein IJJ01_11620 [Firmicutes bacterium]|nr:hypothetical protein [Bacillota bacterium]